MSRGKKRKRMLRGNKECGGSWNGNMGLGDIIFNLTWV
jgi:hypothetical protein